MENYPTIKLAWVVSLCKDDGGGQIYAIIEDTKEKAEEWALNNIVQGDMRWLYRDGNWRKGNMYIEIEEHEFFDSEY